MKIRKLLIAFMMFVVVFSAGDAEARKAHHSRHAVARHAKHRPVAGVARTAGYADIVIDARSGRIIHEVDANALRHPASLTKMMTLYLAFQSLESGRLTLNQTLPVSENAAGQSPSHLGLHAGQHIRVEDAVLGVVTESANDAAVVLGEAMGGSEEGFADLMTRQARALGMTKTRFCNPSGLPDDDQVTTAHDMAVLGAALIHHFPQFYPYFSHDSFTYAGVYHGNHNHLMERYDGMDGIKTGYIRASGFNLVASVKRGNTRLIGVVFGGRSAVARDNHMAQLLDESFDAARVEARTPRIASTNGEGDGDEDSAEYVTLPAKVAAVFPSRNALPEPAPQYEPPARRPVAQPAVQTFAPPPPPARAARGPTWGVQIGAYSDAAIGKQALSSLVASMPGLLANAEPQVQKVSAGAGMVLYRARLMSIDKKTAQNLCTYLNRRGKSCLTVEP